MGSGYDVTTPSGADQEVFEAARRLESPDERLALVRRMCGGDAGAEARIVALLRAHDAAGRFLESTPPEIANLAGAAHSTLVESPGDEIGPYKLLQEIGHGGMGVVYMAEQCRPVRRRVALKIIKPGMDSREVVARFEAERQAMAMMDHAHIAKVLDAGTTASGRPFFVMELVKGIPINRYCDEQRLSLRERLELFVPVCQAVQHAHQKGIIHRDLKPSNILVALYDGRPVPKVIDFGVAKATSQKLTDKTMFTHFGQVVGTLEYMSPEQASVNQLDIDTRSDVYALGVVLYELLTGTTPLDRQRLASLAFDELMRIIRSEDPPRPSMRISSTNTSPETAACRQLDLKKLNLLLRGELDWIVMKALEKDRNRRYESANGLAADLQRYLNDEPVTACPPSASYRFRKFARRNKVALATAGTVAVALIAGTAVSAWQAVRATRAEVRARANESRALAEETRARRAEAKALAAADAERTAKQAESAQREQAEINFKLALDAVDRSFVQISENPRLQAHGLELLRRDLLQTSKEFYEQFITQRRQDPELRRELGQAYLRLADIHQALGEPAEAVSLYELARNVREELLRENPANANLERDLAQSLTLLGETLHELRQYDEAEKIFARALQIQEKLAQRAPHDLTLQSYVAGTVYAIGHVYLQTNRLNEALECFTRSRHLAVQLREQAPEKGTDYVVNSIEHDEPDKNELGYFLAICLHELGYVQSRLGNHTEAQTAFDETLHVIEKLPTEGPAALKFQLAMSHAANDMAVTYASQGQLAEATRLFELAISVREAMALAHPDVPSYRDGLAHLYLNLARYHESFGLAECTPWYEKALDIRQSLVRSHPNIGEYRHGLATAQNYFAIYHMKQKQYGQASRLFSDALSHWDALSTAHPDFFDAKAGLANACVNLGDTLRLMNGMNDESLRLYARTIAIREELVRDDPNNPDRYHHLVLSYSDQDVTDLRDPLRAIELAEKAVALRPSHAKYYYGLGLAQLRARRFSDAVTTFEKAASLSAISPAPIDILLSMAYWQLGHKEKARQAYHRATRSQEKNPNISFSRHVEEATAMLGIEPSKVD